MNENVHSEERIQRKEVRFAQVKSEKRKEKSGCFAWAKGTDDCYALTDLLGALVGFSVKNLEKWNNIVIFAPLKM